MGSAGEHLEEREGEGEGSAGDHPEEGEGEVVRKIGGASGRGSAVTTDDISGLY